MLNNTDATNTTENANNTNVLNWTHSEKSNVLGAFFYGYFIMQVPGGRLAEVFGQKKIFGVTMLLCAVIAALTPIACTVNVWLVFVMRVVQGLLQAPAFPGLNPMTNQWVPEEEKGKFMSFAYMGGTFGACITYPLCGWILDTMPWQAVFYITSAITALWVLGWFFLVFDSPENDPFISQEEKDFILKTRSYDADKVAEDLAVPLLPLVYDIIKTPAVWVDMMGDFCNGWGFYTILTEGPTYVNDVLGFDISTNGWLSALPHFCRGIFGQVFGVVSDTLINKGTLSPLNTQKVIASLAFMMPAMGMVAVSFLSSEEMKWYCILVMAVTFGFNGGAFSGHIQNIIKLAPNRSGTCYGVTNGFGNFAGFSVPYVVGAITADGNQHNPDAWRWVFYIAAALYTFETIYFCIAASGKAKHLIQKFIRK